MYVRRFYSSRHLFFLLLIICIITNANSELENKTFYCLLDNAPVIEFLNEHENRFNKIVTEFKGFFHSEIEQLFMRCSRKGVANSVREIFGLIRMGIDARTSMVPAGALVTDCAIGCDLASGFFPALEMAVISSGCAALHQVEDNVDETIVRMKASWLSLAKPLNLFLDQFKWKTVAIICSYKASLKVAAELVGSALRGNSIFVNFIDVDQETEIISTSDVITVTKMTSALNAAGKNNNSEYRVTT